MDNQIDKLASAVQSNVWAGLQGYQITRLPDDLIKDAVVDERLKIIYELTNKGEDIFKELATSINCIPIDCKNIEKCGSCNDYCGTPTAHFEIPQFISGSLQFLGSPDKQLSFNYYTSPITLKYRKYKKRANTKPYVWIDETPNENGYYDCFVFNAPLLQSVSIIAVFKDPRQLDVFNCCDSMEQNSAISFINNEIVKRLTEKLIRWYRSSINVQQT